MSPTVTFHLQSADGTPHTLCAKAGQSLMQAAMDGFEVKKLVPNVHRADIIITTTGNFNIVTEAAFRKMKDKGIVCNMGHCDNEIDIAWVKMAKGNTKLGYKYE